MNPPNDRQPLKRNRIRKRRTFTHVKRHVTPNSVPSQSQTTDIPSGSNEVESSEVESSEVELEVDQCVAGSSTSGLTDHDYTVLSPESRAGSSLSHISNISGALSVSMSDISVSEDASQSDSGTTNMFSPISPAAISPWHRDETVTESHESQDIKKSAELLLLARNNLFLMLPANFVIIIDHESLHVLMIRRRQSKAVQRQLTVSLSGDIKLQVHGEDFPTHLVMSGVRDQQPLTEDTCGHFVDRIVKVVSNLRLFEVCAGMDAKELKEAWSEVPSGAIEGDNFKECRYTETFRSKKCSILVESKHWRCKECTKLGPILKRRIQSKQSEKQHKCTNHRFLRGKQKDILLAEKQKTIKVQKQTITRLQAKMKEMIEQQGVKVEENLSNDLSQILESADLTPNQSLFLQQQIKAIKCKKSCGMRWHPTLIRMALSLYLKAPGAYNELQESGFLILPTSRTLFDYSHVTKVEPGVDSTVVETLVKQVTAIESERSQPQYHVVMADEMHLSKNLVLLKSTGELIGFKDLDFLDQELASLELHLSEPDKPLEPELASKVMAFMVKGVTSNVKHVVASYPVCNPSSRQMYMWTWEVVGAGEHPLAAV